MRAEEVATSLTRRFPKNAEPWKVLGAVLNQSGKFKDSLGAMRKSIEFAPTDYEAHMNLAVTLKALGRYEEAEASYRKALLINPDFAEGHYNFGVLLSVQSKYKEAESRFAKAVALRDVYPEANYNLGVMLHLQGKLKEASGCYSEAIAQQPDYPEALLNLANVLTDLGNFDEAERRYQTLVEVHPNFPEAHYNFGRLLYKLGRLKESEIRYIKAISLNKSLASAHSDLGNTLKDLKREVEAEASYRNAIRIDPRHSDAHFNLGLLLRQKGVLKEAINHFNLSPGHNSTSQAMECLYIDKDYVAFEKRMKTIAQSDDRNIRLAAVSAFVSQQTETRDLYNFCKNPLDFVFKANLSEFIGDANRLIEGIIEEANRLKLSWESATTKSGFQSSNKIFDTPDRNIARLKATLLMAIEVYYDQFKDEDNSFIKNWPVGRELIGHYNILLKNGYQDSHIHPTGWLSGVIYLKTVSSPNNNEGAVEFSLHGYDLPIIRNNIPKKVHRPSRGDIVLFPSSLFHRTVPFYQDMERCVIAFDLLPDSLNV